MLPYPGDLVTSCHLHIISTEPSAYPHTAHVFSPLSRPPALEFPKELVKNIHVCPPRSSPYHCHCCQNQALWTWGPGVCILDHLSLEDSDTPEVWEAPSWAANSMTGSLLYLQLSSIYLSRREVTCQYVALESECLCTVPTNYVPLLPCVNENNYSAYLIRLCWGLNKTKCIEHLKQCLAHSVHSLNLSFHETDW